MTESPNVSGQDIPGHAPLPVRARALFASALRECSIERAMERVPSRIATTGDGAAACCSARTGRIRSPASISPHCRHLRIVAVGKAAGVMLEAALLHLALPPEDRYPGHRHRAVVALFPARRLSVLRGRPSASERRLVRWRARGTRPARRNPAVNASPRARRRAPPKRSASSC